MISRHLLIIFSSGKDSHISIGSDSVGSAATLCILAELNIILHQFKARLKIDCFLYSPTSIYEFFPYSC